MAKEQAPGPKGWPPGTKCVITWVRTNPPYGAKYPVGSTVTCRTRVRDGSLWGDPGNYYQDIGEVWQRVDWMRPIDEDADYMDGEVVREYCRPQKACNSEPDTVG